MSSVKVVRPKNRYSSLSAPGLLRLMGRAGGFPLRFDPADPEGGPEGNGAVAWARPTMVTLLQLTLMFLCWLQVKLEYGGFTRVAGAAEAMGLAEVKLVTSVYSPRIHFINCCHHRRLISGCR